MRLKNGGSSVIGLKTKRTIEESWTPLSPREAPLNFVRCKTTSGSPAHRTSRSTTIASKSSPCNGTAFIPTIAGGCLPNDNLENVMWPKSELSCMRSSSSLFNMEQTVLLMAGHSNPSNTWTVSPRSHSGAVTQGGRQPSRYRMSSSDRRSFTIRTVAAKRARSWARTAAGRWICMCQGEKSFGGHR